MCKMAASSLLCNLRPECFSNDYVPEHSGVCFNCETLKCELKNTQDELKSAWLIVELLVNEVNTLKACSEANESDLKTEDINPADFHNWIPIKRAHSISEPLRLISRLPVIAPASFPFAFHFLAFHVVPFLLAPVLG